MKKLRSYQSEAIQSLNQSFLVRKKHLLVLPTGAGKTFTIANFLKTKKEKALVIAHTREIINQTQKEFKDVIGNNAHCIISIQKAIKNINFLNDKNYEILIIDECHRTPAKSYIKLINELGFQDKHLIGITATPFRSDKQSIYEIFGKHTFKITILDLIEQGYSSDFIGFRIKTNISLKGISTKNGDFIASKLSNIINVKNRNHLILNEYKKLEDSNKTLAFCANIRHGKELDKLFKENGIKSEFLDGNVSDKNRSKILCDFKNNKIKIIFNCQILTEGFDEPSINTLFMCRPTLSKTLYIQMIGRGSRVFPGKENCKVYEFTDNDYDVASLEDLLDSPQKKIIIKNGESFREFCNRFEQMPEGNEEVIIEEMSLIKNTIIKKPATSWQLNTLKKNNIEFNRTITEFEATKLLEKIYGKYN